MGGYVEVDMTLVSPDKIELNAEITSAGVNRPIEQLASVINGQLDNTNISSVSGSKLQDGTVTAPKLAQSSVTTEALADGAVTAEKIDFTTLESEANMTNGSGVSGTIRARKHRGMVTISGEVTGTIGAGNVQIGTLPVGFRPAERTAINTLFNGAIPGSGLVETSGAVYVTHTSSSRSSVIIGGTLHAG